jgi:biopolymer transport protein ExbD
MLLNAKSKDTTPAIELTPIIDIVFLLLIFFLVATTFQQSEREMQIALPVAESGGPISVSLRELIINVQADGGIIVSGRTVSIEDLRLIVAEAVEANPEQKVTIRADQSSTYNQVVGVLDACKLSGIQEPYLDTVPTR